MFLPATLVLILVIYVVLLFAVARWGEIRSQRGEMVSNSWVYGLSMAVYCTSWTFYGSVGAAANSGIQFVATNLGPSLLLLFGWPLMRRLVRLKNRYHITSIADFISTRYNKSQWLAALVTLIALIGVVPYISLQLKAVVTTFELASGEPSISGVNVEMVTVVLMTLFTILLGVRHLDPTERHQGMMLALAAESLVKLIAFVAAGVYVTYGMFDGFDDLFQRFSDAAELSPELQRLQSPPPFMKWTSLIILGMAAILLLPRQFHVMVVENSDEKHIRTGQWIFPLYLLVINLFVIPIAMGGLVSGLQPEQADSFVIRLPLMQNQSSLTLLVFIGGFSAATGMIMVSAMTLSTMWTNHILLPVLERLQHLNWLRRYLLQCRWLAVAAIIYSGYLFNLMIGDSFMLVNMGLFSFAAVLQFAPALLGGLFWRGGNLRGALFGIIMGFIVWSYTLLLPAFVKSGWLPTSLLDQGLFGLSVLRPEQLFGIDVMDSLSHAVFWSLLFNILGFVLGSIASRTSETEQRQAQEFVDVLDVESPPPLHLEAEANMPLAPKLQRIARCFLHYLSEQATERAIQCCLEVTGLKEREQVSIVELAYLRKEAENRLAGSIGGAAAHRAVEACGLFNEREQRQLSHACSSLLGQMKLTPDELWNRVDYHQERERMLSEHAERQQSMIDRLKCEVEQREHADAALKTLNEELENRVQKRTTQLESSNQNLGETLEHLKETQTQLVEAKKMAALGGLVAGVAHEINTPLGNCLTAASLLHDEAALLDRKIRSTGLTKKDLYDYNQLTHESLQIILNNADRAAQLVQNFKQVAVDQGSEEKCTFSLREYIDEVLLSLQSELNKGQHQVRIEGHESLRIDSFPGAFSQILTNLIMNSLLHAFKPDQTGKILIRFVCHDQWLQLEYRDNGRGMSDEQLAKVFDPFYTTKRNIGGIGLGAHIIYNLVTQRLQGRIRCESCPVQGVRFLIELPMNIEEIRSPLVRQTVVNL
ncbi:MAG: ATP-binding protein [Motiliproteus sp.]